MTISSVRRESIFARATIRVVLRLAGITEPDRSGRLRCPLPGHDDRQPSFKIVGEPATGWVCYGCGRRGGIVDLVIALGFARDRSSAARWLETRIR